MSEHSVAAQVGCPPHECGSTYLFEMSGVFTVHGRIEVLNDEGGKVDSGKTCRARNLVGTDKEEPTESHPSKF